MSQYDTLARGLKLQADVCRSMGSPFSADLLERAAGAIDGEGPVRQAFAPWAACDVRRLFTAAVALRWLGALHDMALAEPGSRLAAAYPANGRPGDPEAAWPIVLEHLANHAEAVADFMSHEPQTNEVRRSAVLMPGFLTVAAETGMPMRILELGASAGLNQLWDRRRYDLGEAGAWGPPDAPMTIDVDWQGGAPPLAASVSVAERAACDRKPVDIADPLARRRLTAYVWPDQFDRLERLNAAIAQSLAAGVRVDTADAPAWAADHARPAPGVVTVVFHSVFFQYMPAESQAALKAALEAYGAVASHAAPLAWLRMEPANDNPAVMELRLTLWPNGEDRLLATAHPHGAWVHWLG